MTNLIQLSLLVEVSRAGLRSTETNSRGPLLLNGADDCVFVCVFHDMSGVCVLRGNR